VNIIIDENVKEYLLKKGHSSITVDSAGEMSCCISIPLPLLILGAPSKKLESFVKYSVGEYTVFLNKYLPVEDTLRFLLKNYFIKKVLVIDGIRMA
jgi:hypothetical protein